MASLEGALKKLSLKTFEKLLKILFGINAVYLVGGAIQADSRKPQEIFH